MKNKTTFILLICFPFFLTIVFNNSYAQNIDFGKSNFPGKEEELKEALRNIKKGDALYNAGTQMYNLALDYYLKANAFNSENAELNYKIGVCYLYSSFKQKSIYYLNKAKSLNPEVNNKLSYYFGRAYHLSMQWDNAIGQYETYKKLIAGTADETISDVDKKIQECKNGISLMKDTLRVSKLPDSVQYHIENLGVNINSKYPDYRPVISADESVLYFTSRRENTTGAGIDPYDGKYYEDIYVSTNENGNWTEAKNLGDPINRHNQHDATCGLSVDGDRKSVV